MTYRSGELDQLIDIIRNDETEDGVGGVDITPVILVDDLYAHVRPISGSEVNRFDKLNAIMTNLFVVRYRDDILETDLILWEGDQYNIRSIPKKGIRAQYLEIYAERGVAQ